jgi:putative hydrolase of HD superfamily
MLQNTAHQIIAFMDTVEKLCHVKRFTLLADGRQENDSDHIMKLCFLVMMVSPYLKHPHSPQKLLEMALVHDLVEADCGDIPYFSQMTAPELKELKKKNEHAAIEKYKTTLPPPLDEKVYALFMEYEAATSFEAKIIHALDIFEGNLQCNKENFGARYWKLGVGKRVEAMRTHEYGNNIDEDIIRCLEDALVKLSDDNKAKCQQEGLESLA